MSKMRINIGQQADRAVSGANQIYQHLNTGRASDLRNFEKLTFQSSIRASLAIKVKSKKTLQTYFFKVP